ncbi:MAG: peptide MFS transporter [Blastocatellia bacterium]|nr:peptide MFS transporter [Blastocatellia bacterium]
MEIEHKQRDHGGFGGHPKGLTMLFFTELWERFSYYGMRAILTLYMVAESAEGGLEFTVKEAASLYGTYTMTVYLMSMPGGLLGDYVLGARRAVLIGGIIIALGHFAMVFQSLPFFYCGLALIALGSGLLKPNISSMVGGLYGTNDARRDAGFSIFYMGINLGAVLAPLVCGFLAQSKQFRGWLASVGLAPTASWHWGFGAAGIGMVIGLVVYLTQLKWVTHVGDLKNRPLAGRTEKTAATTAVSEKLTSAEWKRIGAIVILFVFTICFWTAYEQKGISLNLFAKESVRNQLWGFEVPSSWFQSMTAFFVILLAPLFAKIWSLLGDRQPSSPGKFTLGLFFISLGYFLMIPASLLTATGKISPLWLVGLYFLEVTGEMCISPVGLSTVSKLAPAKVLGIMLGVWFLASSLGNKMAGFIGGFYVAKDAHRLATMYGGIAVGLLVACGILALLTPTIRKMMGGVK